MSTTFSISARQAYGIARVCRVWGVSRASYYRRTGPAPEAENQSMRRGPVGAMPDSALFSQIAKLIEGSPFHGEGYTARCGLACAINAFSPLRSAFAA